MGELFFQRVFEYGAEVRAVADGEVAGVRAGARGHIDAGLEAQGVPTQIAQDAVHHRQVGFHDVGQEQILALGDADGPGGVGSQGVEQVSRARRGFVAEGHAYAHGKAALLFLGEHVGLAPGFVSDGRRNLLHGRGSDGDVFRMRHVREGPRRHGALTRNRFKQRIASHGLVEELEPRLLALGPFSVAVKHPEDGLGDRDEFVGGHPLVQDFGRGRLGAKPTSHKKFESALTRIIHRGQHAQVVHHAESGVFV